MNVRIVNRDSDIREPGKTRRKLCRGGFSVPVLAVAAGALLLTLAVPRMNAAFIRLPSDTTSLALARGKTVTPDAVEKLIATRSHARAWVNDASGWFDTGLARLAGARRAGAGTPAAAVLLDQAADAYRSGLARSPGNAIQWMRLAQVRLLREGPTARAAAALHMSLGAAPFQTGILIERLRLGFVLWPGLDEQGRRAVVREVAMARRAQYIAPSLKRLAEDPEIRDRFAHAVETIKAMERAAKDAAGSVSIEIKP